MRTATDEEDVRFAAVAADIATAVGEEGNCVGTPGQTPTTLESSDSSRRPPAEASGGARICPAEQLVGAAVTEWPVGQGVAETCRLHLGDITFDLHVAYGPIDHPWWDEVSRLDVPATACPSPLDPTRHSAMSREERMPFRLPDMLDAFAVASAGRHGRDAPGTLDRARPVAGAAEGGRPGR
ncbi:hypothetical protein [Streptomyces marincola]|uniref:hypothetical protein n=1 Tax=Streptomyces marincola TaxID=2878388 RepID=UPI00131E5DF9|nr:hypothetical protein [Streptomyces marincola]